MSEDQATPEQAEPQAKRAPTRQEARQEMLEKVRKARESRMRHQNPQADADAGTSRTARNDRGYGGRPAPHGNSRAGAPVRKKDPAG